MMKTWGLISISAAILVSLFGAVLFGETASDFSSVSAGMSVKEKAIAVAPESCRVALIEAFGKAGDRADYLAEVIVTARPSQRDGACFLIAGMPDGDLMTLDADFLRRNLHAAYASLERARWKKDIPEEVFRNGVLPYANVDEKREEWRAQLGPIAAKLTANCETSSEAALQLNEKLFAELHVQYHPTKRPKPNQSPSESIASGYASCTGLSVLLIDACRCVGVPARLVATPSWVVPQGDANGNHAGNHSWVEIWDRQWRAVGASEPGPLDKTWFLKNASGAKDATDPMHMIYAVSWQKSDCVFPLIWNLADRSRSAENVTATYGDRRETLVKTKNPVHTTGFVHFSLRLNGQLLADARTNERGIPLYLSQGVKYEVRVLSDEGGKDLGATSELCDETPTLVIEN